MSRYFLHFLALHVTPHWNCKILESWKNEKVIHQGIHMIQLYIYVCWKRNAVYSGVWVGALIVQNWVIMVRDKILFKWLHKEQNFVRYSYGYYYTFVMSIGGQMYWHSLCTLSSNLMTMKSEILCHHYHDYFKHLSEKGVDLGHILL